MTDRRFSAEIDTYVVLLLDLNEYRATSRAPLDGFEIAGAERCQALRKQEKIMLKDKFEDWEIPYCARLRGWRSDSPIYVAHGEELVGGVYLCDKNEFDEDPARGQLHYAFINSRFQGMGIYSMIFREAVRRADTWGLKGLYLNSDRHLLPDVYLRWGAKPWKEVKKPSRLPYNAIGGILRAVRRRLVSIKWMWFNPCE